MGSLPVEGEAKRELVIAYISNLIDLSVFENMFASLVTSRNQVKTFTKDCFALIKKLH